MMDFPPPPKLWLPSKPAIIRAASADDQRLVRQAREPYLKAMFPFPVFFPGGGNVSILLSTSGKTPIGNMTGAGGLAAAFDGNTNQDTLSCARIDPSTATDTVGIDWASGQTRTITRFILYGPNDNTVLGGGNPTTVKLQGSTDNFASSTVDLMVAVTVSGTVTSLVLDVTTGITITTAYRYHRILLVGNAVNTMQLSELQFYGYA